MTAEAWNDNYTVASVTWDSSDKEVATVDGGAISLLAAGRTTITATAGDQSDSFELEVIDGDISVTDVTVSPTSANIKVGGTKQLTATVAPANATNQTVTWSSSASDVAEVSAEGLVTAKKLGSGTITATTEDGNITATCEVSVADYETFAEIDFTAVLTASEILAEAKSDKPVQIKDTQCYVIFGSDGSAITGNTQTPKGGSKVPCLNFGGTGAIKKNALYFTAKQGKALITVSYFSGSAGRYVKVLNADMDKTVADDEKTTSDKEIKTRAIAIEVDSDDTEIYLGSASSGIYVTAIKVEYEK